MRCVGRYRSPLPAPAFAARSPLPAPCAARMPARALKGRHRPDPHQRSATGPGPGGASTSDPAESRPRGRLAPAVAAIGADPRPDSRAAPGEWLSGEPTRRLPRRHDAWPVGRARGQRAGGGPGARPGADHAPRGCAARGHGPGAGSSRRGAGRGAESRVRRGRVPAHHDAIPAPALGTGAGGLQARAGRSAGADSHRRCRAGLHAAGDARGVRAHSPGRAGVRLEPDDRSAAGPLVYAARAGVFGREAGPERDHTFRCDGGQRPGQPGIRGGRSGTAGCIPDKLPRHGSHGAVRGRRSDGAR